MCVDSVEPISIPHLFDALLNGFGFGIIEKIHKVY